MSSRHLCALALHAAIFGFFYFFFPDFFYFRWCWPCLLIRFCPGQFGFGRRSFFSLLVERLPRKRSRWSSRRIDVTKLWRALLYTWELVDCGLHDDWQQLVAFQLLLHTSSFVFVLLCVCLPLNLTRQATDFSGALGKKSKTTGFTYIGKDDPIQLTWWQLDVDFCFSSSAVCLLNFWKELSSSSFFNRKRKNLKYRPPLRFLLVVDFFFQLASPLSLKLWEKKDRYQTIRSVMVFDCLSVCPWEEESHSTHEI